MFGIDDILLGGLGLASNIWGGNKQADMARQQAEQQQQMFQQQMGLQSAELARQQALDKARQAAYQQSLTAGQQASQAGEAGFMGANVPLTGLEQAKKDILSGSARGLGQASEQMQAQMAAGGVRGGQLATQLRRGIGEMGTQTQEQLNRVGLEDEQRRQQQMLAFQAAKAQAGQQAALRTPTF